MNIKMETRLHSTGNNNSNKKSDIIHNHIHHHHLPTKPNENDNIKFSYQSEFARSLAYNNFNSITTTSDAGQNQSLDFALSFRIENKNFSDSSLSTSSMLSSSASRSPSPIQSQLPTTSLNLNDCIANNSIDDDCPPQVISNPKQHYNSTNKFTTNELRFQQDISKNKPFTTEIEVLRLRKECQNLIEDNRRLIKSKAENDLSHMDGTTNNVEAVILQSQVNTLQWQLKQVESSRQMYHAVMEEVVRYLERCHQSLNAIDHLNLIGNKTKSSSGLNYASGNGQQQQQQQSGSDCMSLSRVRTSTIIMDDLNETVTPDDPCNETMTSMTSSMGSYSNFRDFTWRRAPKSKQPLFTTNGSNIENCELDPNKLAQEAFRLLRTAQNLLNLKEPLLSDSKFPARYHVDNKINNLPCTTTSTLGRKFNSRESRLSIQSSTDDSVHSTSSSRNETDEESNNVAIGSGHHILQHNHHQPQSTSSSTSSFFGISPASIMARKQLVKSVASSVDDESGFSSMNSFQEIGLPATTASGAIIDKSEDSSTAEDTTIVEVQTNNNGGEYFDYSNASENNDVIPIVHRRWSSAPPIPPKRSVLSTLTKHNGDEALKVLWV